MKKKEKEILIKLVLFMKIKMFFLNQKKKFSDEFELAWIRFSKLINLLGKKYAEVILAAVF